LVTSTPGLEAGKVIFSTARLLSTLSRYDPLAFFTNGKRPPFLESIHQQRPE
jgi:hypothetical protein